MGCLFYRSSTTLEAYSWSNLLLHSRSTADHKLSVNTVFIKLNLSFFTLPLLLMVLSNTHECNSYLSWNENGCLLPEFLLCIWNCWLICFAVTPEVHLICLCTKSYLEFHLARCLVFAIEIKRWWVASDY